MKTDLEQRDQQNMKLF